MSRRAKRTRRTFSREYKIEAVRMITKGGNSVSQIAEDLDVRPDMLRRWKRKFEQDESNAFPGNGQLRGEAQLLRKLERENQRLRQERDILKKALAIFSKPTR